MVALAPGVAAQITPSEPAQRLYQQALESSVVTTRIELLNQAVALAPDFLAAVLELGKQYYQINANTEAQKQFLAVISINPQNADAYAYLGQIYLRGQKYQSAATFLQQAIKWQSNHPVALDGLRQIELYQQQTAAAQKIENTIDAQNYEQALDLYRKFNNQFPEAKIVRAFRQRIAQHYFEIGNQALQANQFPEALAAFEKVQSIFPGYLDLDRKMNSIESRRVAFSRIEITYQRALEAFGAGDWEAAANGFGQVLALDPQYKDAATRQARAQQEQQRLAQAAESLATSPRDTTAFTTSTEIPVVVIKPPPDMFPKAPPVKSQSRPPVTWYKALETRLKSNRYWMLGGLSGILLAIWIWRRRRHRPVVETAAGFPIQEPGLTSGLRAPTYVDTASSPIPAASTSNFQPGFSMARRFELKQLESQFGEVKVYQALDRRLNRLVLIDRITFATENQNLLPTQKQVIDGVQFAAALHHPNILRVEDVFIQDNAVFVILEYLPNQTLEHYLRTRKGISVQISVQMIQQLCVALDYAHQQGVIHFDLRPFHVKIVNGERLKLAGFELARLNHFRQLPASGAPALAPDYLSPEQIRDGEIDLRTDIFSLGVLFYQMLTGRKPFVGDLASAVIFHILEGNPVPPSAITAEIPTGLDQLILKMLAKEPGDRFFSTQEIAVQLKKYL